MTQVYGAKFRYRPPEEVVEEVKTLMRLGKRKFVYFVDDIFNAHRKHAFAVMEGLQAAQGRTGPASARPTSATTPRCST